MSSESFHIDPSLWEKLADEARRRGLNTSDLLTEAIRSFLYPAGSPKNDEEKSQLEKLAGTWPPELAEEFEKNVAVFSEIDYEMWK